MADLTERTIGLAWEQIAEHAGDTTVYLYSGEARVYVGDTPPGAATRGIPLSLNAAPGDRDRAWFSHTRAEPLWVKATAGDTMIGFLA